jgi:hypothetical protein
VTEQPTKTCIKCGEAKPLVAFAGRQLSCISCRDAQRQRTMERKDGAVYSPAIAEKIVDLIAAGTPVAEICQPAGMPTERQLARWRRTIPEFADAYEQARQARADARSDKIDAALNDLRAGRITAADCRVIVETELKMAGKENPARYGDVQKIQQEVSGPGGAPLAVQVVDDASLIKAARWVADLLSKADAVPVIDLQPEGKAA